MVNEHVGRKTRELKFNKLQPGLSVRPITKRATKQFTRSVYCRYRIFQKMGYRQSTIFTITAIWIMLQLDIFRRIKEKFDQHGNKIRLK